MNTVKKIGMNWVREGEIQEAMEEATTDCYDESEQCMGISTMVASLKWRSRF